MVNPFVEPLIEAILIGSLYTLAGIGVTLLVSTMRFFNFAEGELVTIGAYTATVTVVSLQTSFVIGIAAAAIVSAAAALASYLLVFKPLEARGATWSTLTLASFAVSIVTRELVYIYASSLNILRYRPILPTIIFQFGDMRLTDIFLLAVPSTITLVLILALIFKRTKIGKAMRALADNRELAGVAGIDTGKIILVTWIIVGIFAGVAGSFWGIETTTYPDLGSVVMFGAFAASLIGGFSSYYATIAGGFIIGFAENIFLMFLYLTFNFNVAFQPLITFTIIIVLFLARPKD